MVLNSLASPLSLSTKCSATSVIIYHQNDKREYREKNIRLR